jgi:hypothetical protein
MRRIVCCFAIVAATPLVVAAADLRAEFLDLEARLMVAAQSKRVEEEKALVSEDFAWSMAFEGRANEVMTRGEWLRGVDYYDLQQFEISQLTAQEVGNVVVTNFRFARTATFADQLDVSGELVFTDLWHKNGGAWLLARRFVSRAAPVPAKK